MAEQRLIDANNLIEEIREERCYNCRNFKDMKCDYCGTADYIYMIEDMPAVEARPVVHAHWTGSNGTYCSHCERSYMDVADADSWESSDIPDFCPYCGAQMDEKEDKHEDYT